MHQLSSVILRIFVLPAIAIACLGSSDSWAKTKKLDNDSLKMAKVLNKDREKAFSGKEGMPLNKFQEQWAALAERLNNLYGGHKVRMNKFGSHVRFRQGFAQLTYLGLRTHSRVTPLKPSPQELVSRHPFLQELVLEGSCYTGGGRYQKQVADLIAVDPDLQHLLRERIEKWDTKHRGKFEILFPVEAAKSMN